MGLVITVQKDEIILIDNRIRVSIYKQGPHLKAHIECDKDIPISRMQLEIPREIKVGRKPKRSIVREINLTVSK